jgi:CBS domain-containing protein
MTSSTGWRAAEGHHPRGAALAALAFSQFRARDFSRSLRKIGLDPAWRLKQLVSNCCRNACCFERVSIMTVASIINIKGRAVYSTRPHHTLMEAAKVLAEGRVGAVIASDDGAKVLGIISERDIIRAIAAGGQDALDDPVSKHMTEKVMTVEESTPVLAVMDMMTKGRFRHVPVMDGEKCVAVISIVDIVKHRVQQIEFEHDALHSYISRTI